MVYLRANGDRFFVLFHKLFFNNDYWIFDETTDPVIRILPDGFFLHCAFMILFLIILGSVICLFCYRRQISKYEG